MPEAHLAKEIIISLENKPGALAKVLGAVAAAGVSAKAYTAYADGPRGFVKLVASDADKAVGALGAAGISCSQQDVLTVLLDDTVGAGAEVAARIADAGLNITHSHGSGTGSGKALLVIDTDDNAEALRILGG